MKSESRKSKLNSNEFRQSVLRYFQKQAKFKQIQTQFTELKNEFNNEATDYFECNDISGSFVLDSPDTFEAGTLTVTRIQKSSVEFDPDKLEKALGKELSQNVILKRHEILDMPALVTYLKECGVDPKIFKSFIVTTKSVDTKELDRLEEIGKITTTQVQGCYTVKNQKPYFTVGLRKGQGDND